MYLGRVRRQDLIDELRIKEEVGEESFAALQQRSPEEVRLFFFCSRKSFW